MVAVPLDYLMGEQNHFIHPYWETQSKVPFLSSQLNMLKIVLRVKRAKRVY